jgi:hypothetical protein
VFEWVEAYSYAVSYSYLGQEYFSTEIANFTDNQDPESAVRILGVTDSLILGCIFPSACSYDEENPANKQLDSSCWWSTYGCDCESPQYSEVDECGVCEGPGPENNYDCDGNCTAVDECGICGGDGTSCLSLYNGIIPEVFSIHNIYPNPFNPNANIVYAVPEVSQVTVSVYDIQGRKVVILQNDLKSPGYYEIQWDASELNFIIPWRL